MGDKKKAARKKRNFEKNDNLRFKLASSGFVLLRLPLPGLIEFRLERKKQEHAEMEQTTPKRMPKTKNWQSRRDASDCDVISAIINININVIYIL
jgi:hypothetical protein